MRNPFKKSDKSANPADGQPIGADAGEIDEVVASGVSAEAPSAAPAKKLRPEERLRSVLSESEPGAAIDALGNNVPFIVPNAVEVFDADGNVEFNADAYVVLILPTRGEFGGLSKKTRGRNEEDKGSFISAMIADDIKPVINAELLDEDVLAIIPDADSLSRMEEYKILIEAPYSWGVVMENTETGGLEIFEIPAREATIDIEKGRLDQNLFDDAMRVSKGIIKLEEVVSFPLIGAMCEIFWYGDDEVNDRTYGAAGLAEARQMNMTSLVEGLSKGDYPAEETLISDLVETFPVLAVTRFGDYTREALGTSPADSGADHRATHLEETRTFDVIDDDDDGDDFGEGAEDGSGDSGETDGVEPDFFGDGGEPDFGDDDELAADDSIFDEPGSDGEQSPDTLLAAAMADPAAVSVDASEASVPVVAADPVMQERLARIESMLADLGGNQLDADMVREILSESNVSGLPSPGQVAAADDREFSFGDVEQASQIGFANEDLGLQINLDYFANALAYPPHEIMMPTGIKHTPWLNEQLETLVSYFNSELYSAHQQSMMALQSTYIGLADLSVKEIDDKLDHNNPDTDFGKLNKAIEDDDAQLKTENHEIVQSVRAALAREREADKNKWIEARIAGLGQEWERNNAPRWDRRIDRRIAEVQGHPDRVRESNIANMHERRRLEAARLYDGQVPQIVDNMRPMAEEMRKQEIEIFEAGVKAIQDFIDEHAAEDIRIADVNERKLAADNRVEQIQKEAGASIEAIRAESAKYRKEMEDRLAQAREDHAEQLALREEITATEVANAKRETELLRVALDKQMSDHNIAMEAAKKDSAEIIKRYEDKAAVADQAVKDVARESERKNTQNITMLVVVAIVALVLGVLISALVIPGMIT